jgi:hypothetical protein
MDAAWQVLRDAGLPLAAPRSGARPAPEEIGRAVLHVMRAELAPRDADALAAFVLAWRHEWPASFAVTFGERQGPLVAAWAQRQLTDDNRYLKLRRIAIANLADLL